MFLFLKEEENTVKFGDLSMCRYSFDLRIVSVYKSVDVVFRMIQQAKFLNLSVEYYTVFVLLV